MNCESTYGKVVLYQDEKGHLELNVLLQEETVWLSLNQLVELFGRDKSVISRHIRNIFKAKELGDATVAKFATVQTEGEREVSRDIEYFNLDMIISVGYRVNSLRGIQFRRWATGVLKQHLLEGFTYHEKRLQEKGLTVFQETLSLLERTLTQQQLVNELGTQVIQLISDYAKSWHLLLAYDENKLMLPDIAKSSRIFLYEEAQSAISSLKSALWKKSEASDLFGQERDNGLASILGNLEQTFSGESLYQTPEEKAAHLLYFIIKDHPFVDGNKRIGSFLFLLYLEQQQISKRLDDRGLVALALLVAESAPSQKEILIRLTVNLL